MGVCINILDIPIFEDSECRARREQNANKRKGKKQEEKTERQENRQENRTERKQIEEESDVAKSFARNYGTGETPFEGALGDLTTMYGALGSALLPGLTGGLGGIPSLLGGLVGGVGDALGVTDEDTGTVDLFPVALAVGAGVVLVMVLTSDGRR